MLFKQAAVLLLKKHMAGVASVSKRGEEGGSHTFILQEGGRREKSSPSCLCLSRGEHYQRAALKQAPHSDASAALGSVFHHQLASLLLWHAASLKHSSASALSLTCSLICCSFRKEEESTCLLTIKCLLHYAF